MKLLFIFCTLAITLSMIQAQNYVKVNRDLIVTWDKAKLLKFFGEKYLDCWYDQEPNYIHQEALWDVLNIDVLKKDEEARKAYNFAVDYLLEFGVCEGVLKPKTSYSVYSINLFQQNQANDTYYFDITFKNDCYEKDLVRLAASVDINPKTCKAEINQAYVFTGLFLSDPNVGFLDFYYKTSLTWKEFQKNEDIQEIFLYGLNTLIKKAIYAKVLKNANYYVDTLYTAAISPNKYTTYYLFDSQLVTQSKGVVNATFIVKSYKGKLTLVRYAIYTIL